MAGSRSSTRIRADNPLLALRERGEAVAALREEVIDGHAVASRAVERLSVQRHGAGNHAPARLRVCALREPLSAGR